MPPSENKKDVRVVCIATDMNLECRNFIATLKKYNYDYEIIGLGEKWEGFQMKITLVRDYLEKIKSNWDNTIIIYCDCYDSLFLREFETNYLPEEGKVIISSESGGHACSDLSNYRLYHNQENHPTDSSEYCFCCAGFQIGHLNDMIPLYDKLYESLQKQKDLIKKGDIKISEQEINDQILLSEIVNLNPEKYILDVDAHYCLTAHWWQRKNIHIDKDVITYQGKTPLAIHVAFMRSDTSGECKEMYNKTLNSIFYHLS